jgi:glycosyltransferase involved in cell wall biosynthesis
MKSRLAFVGPLPPPVHGFSSACGWMLKCWLAESDVRVFNRTPSAAGAARTFCDQMLKVLRYALLCTRSRNVKLYLAMSGGISQLFDGLYLAISKVFRIEVIVHHHSFHYINSPSTLNRLVFATMRNQTHIVLSQSMGIRLAQIYGLDAAKVKTISNAVMADAVEVEARTQFNRESPICLGFLSNITRDKGIIEFFEVLAQLQASGVAYQAYIAGPLEPSVEERFNELLSSLQNTAYIGPVYGADKAEFYRKLDIFLFPTKYSNEAEPLVIHEAMRAGVYVLANDRGAIHEVLQNGAGQTFREQDFVREAAVQIGVLSADRKALIGGQWSAVAQANRLRLCARAQLDILVAQFSLPSQ